MPLTRMEHYLVLTEDIDATRDFYCDALGMRVGPRNRTAHRVRRRDRATVPRRAVAVRGGAEGADVVLGSGSRVVPALRPPAVRLWPVD